jgi:hypothetical protein
MKQEMFHFLDDQILGEGYNAIVATLMVDPRTAKIYLVREQSYDRDEPDGEVYEYEAKPGCFEFVEVVNYGADYQGPVGWWCHPCEMPKELVRAQTKYRRPARYPTLPED